MTAATEPPTSIKIALLVGAPVKTRETSELNESLALIPKTIRIMPPTSSAIKMALFIEKVPFGFRCPRDLAASLDDSDQKHHHGDDKQYVNEATHCVGAN
jgi:hypothetical protein